MTLATLGAGESLECVREIFELLFTFEGGTPLGTEGTFEANATGNTFVLPPVRLLLLVDAAIAADHFVALTEGTMTTGRGRVAAATFSAATTAETDCCGARCCSS